MHLHWVKWRERRDTWLAMTYRQSTVERNFYQVRREQMPPCRIHSNLSRDPIAEERDFNSIPGLQLIPV
jgi:hypothetical protein